jgi:hypothetical protein
MANAVCFFHACFPPLQSNENSVDGPLCEELLLLSPITVFPRSLDGTWQARLACKLDLAGIISLFLAVCFQCGQALG